MPRKTAEVQVKQTQETVTEVGEVITDGGNVLGTPNETFYGEQKSIKDYTQEDITILAGKDAALKEDTVVKAEAVDTAYLVGKDAALKE